MMIKKQNNTTTKPLNQNKMTAVEWLEIQLFKKQGKFNKSDIDQAKAMEKEMYFQFFKAGQESMEEGGKGFDQYYNEIYKS